jgi:subtilisin family serine protease
MALGGEPGERNGILGIYLGEYPPEPSLSDPEGVGQGWDHVGQRSINGWAWWAGTSFATPVLTGVIAAVLSGKQIPVYSTQRAVDVLYDECIILEAKTEKDEDVIPSSLRQTDPPFGWPLVI